MGKQNTQALNETHWAVYNFSFFVNGRLKIKLFFRKILIKISSFINKQVHAGSLNVFLYTMSQLININFGFITL